MSVFQNLLLSEDAALIRSPVPRHFPLHLRYPARMPQSPERRVDRAATGLCASCLHARRIESTRGSVFILCELSVTDPRFPKYPSLPVLSCGGYKKSS
jgi:hypothetical protein